MSELDEIQQRQWSCIRQSYLACVLLVVGHVSLFVAIFAYPHYWTAVVTGGVLVLIGALVFAHGQWRFGRITGNNATTSEP